MLHIWKMLRKSEMWRNNVYNLWYFAAFCNVLLQNHFFCKLRCFVAKSVFVRFTRFCVEKNWAKNCTRGEKMTIMRYDHWLTSKYNIDNNPESQVSQRRMEICLLIKQSNQFHRQMKIYLFSDKMTSSSLSIVSRKISIASRNLVYKPVTTRKANIFENLRNLCKSNTLLLCRNTSHLCETCDTSSQWFCCKSVKFNLPVDKGKGYMRPLPKCLVVFWPKCLDTFEAKMSGLFWPGTRTW